MASASFAGSVTPRRPTAGCPGHHAVLSACKLEVLRPQLQNGQSEQLWETPPKVALRGSAGKDILSESGYERQIQEYGERKRQRNCQGHGERQRQQWRQTDSE